MSDQQTSITTHSVVTPSGRISYASAGAGPVALFVHGVVLNKHLWRHQLTGLPIPGAALRSIFWRMGIPRSRQIKMSP